MANDVIVIKEPSMVTTVTQSNQAQFNVIIPSGPPGTGGGLNLVEDSENPGLYLLEGSGLIPDPDHPGLYLLGT